jgi:serine/threonine-protein kinase
MGPQLALPRPFGGYQLLEELGRGTTGVVYKSRFERAGSIQGCIRAIKFPTDGRSHRALVEARVLAYLGGRPNSPDIVALHELGEMDGQPYFVRDYVAGSDFANYLGTARTSVSNVAMIVVSVARTVQLIHDAGFRHGNLVLENVLIPQQGNPKLIGFGYARPFDQPDARAFDTDIRALGQLLVTAADRIGQPLPEVLEAITMKCESAGSGWGYRSASEFAEALNRFICG